MADYDIITAPYVPLVIPSTPYGRRRYRQFRRLLRVAAGGGLTPKGNRKLKRLTRWLSDVPRRMREDARHDTRAYGPSPLARLYAPWARQRMLEKFTLNWSLLRMSGEEKK